MMLKIVALAVSCLLLGGFAGYHLRSSEQTAGAMTAASDLEARKNSAHSSAASNIPGKAADAPGAVASLQVDAVSLGERMKSLLENYNSVTAGKAVENLSASDIQAALALVAAMPKSADRDSLRANLYHAWAKTNPTAAWKAAVADPLETDQGYLLGAVAGELVKTKPEAAVALALSLGMGGRREGVFRGLFGEWGKVDLAGAIAYSNKHPDLPVGDWAISQIFGQAGRKDPLRAANLALEVTDQQARSNAISNVLHPWAARDPNAALSWAQTINNPSLRKSATETAISGWAYNNPEAAMTYAQTISDTSTRSSAMQRVWFSWLRKDPAAAMTYVGNSNDERLMEYVGWNFGSGTSSFTQQEKVSLLENLPDGKVKQNIVRSLADSQIQRGQYNQAMELLNDMPDSSERDSTVQQLGKKWAEADLKAAAEWLKVLPDSSDRDLAVAGYVNVLARTDPRAALQWMDTIPDEGVKTGALKNIALRWLTADPATAEVWLAEVSGLSESEKKTLREKAQTNLADLTTYGVNVSNRR